MKKAAATIGSLFGLLAFLSIFPAVAQNPQFPQNLPANSVVGRTGIGSGPAQAIPFANLTPLLTQTTNTWTVLQNLNGGAAITLPTGLGAALTITQTPSGSTSSTTNFNVINLTDTATISGFQFGNGLEINHSFGGSTVQGGRQAFIANAFLTATSNAGSSNRNYVGVVGIGQSNVNDNGTNPAASGTSAGAVFGANFEGILGVSGATSFLGVSGAEFNARIVTGASSWAKSLGQFSSEPLDRVQGTVIDTMLWFYNQSASNPGWNTGLLFDDSGGLGVWPIKSTGTIIKAGATTSPVANGVDFSGLSAISGCAFKSPGFCIDGTGANLTLGSQLSLQHSGNYTIALDGSGSTQGLLIGNNNDATTYLQNTTIKFRNIGGSATFASLASGTFQLNGATSGSMTLSQSATGGHTTFASSSTPTLTAGCNGAGSSVAGNDMSGTVTGQTAAATTCTLQFGTAYGAAPNCVAMGISSPLTTTATPSTTTLVVNFASTANYKFTYFCPGV